MTNQITIEQAIKQYKETVEVNLTTNTLYPMDTQLLSDYLKAIQLLQTVVEENDDDDNVELFEKLANLEEGVQRAVQSIANDSYLLGSWDSNTDFQEYNEWTMDIIQVIYTLVN